MQHLANRIHFLSACTTHYLASTHCALQGSTLKTQVQDEVVSASFIVVPHAHSHPVSLCRCSTLSSLHSRRSSLHPVLLIHNVNVTSEPHKKLVSNSKRTRLSLEGVWPFDRFRSKHNTNVWECIKGWLQLNGEKCSGAILLRNGFQWCFISLVRGPRGLKVPVEFVSL